MNTADVLGVLLVMGLVTAGLRALPFLAAQWLQRHPVVGRLGRSLPLAIMVLLVLHAGRGAASQAAQTWPVPEVLAVGVTALLQWRWRHPLLSIAVGTAVVVGWRQWAGG